VNLGGAVLPSPGEHEDWNRPRGLLLIVSELAEGGRLARAYVPAGETAASLPSLEGGTSSRAFTLASIAGQKAISGSGDGISSRLVRLVKVPKNENILEDASVQPLAHLAAPTVRTFELVYEGGKTEVLLSAETLEDMRKYAGLLGLVYGGMMFESAEPHPNFLRELPRMVIFSGADDRKREGYKAKTRHNS